MKIKFFEKVLTALTSISLLAVLVSSIISISIASITHAVERSDTVHNYIRCDDGVARADCDSPVTPLPSVQPWAGAIGIPDPSVSWGALDPIATSPPAAPISWNSEVAGFYYVDPSHTLATDSGNDYGYPGRPRLTLPQSGVQPGAYIELHGTFPEISTRLTYACTESQPCFIRGASQSEWPTYVGSIGLIDSAYLFIENINFEGGTGGAININGSSHHISVRNNQIKDRAQPGGASTGVSIQPDDGDTVSDVVVYGNRFESLGDWTVTEDIDFHGIGPSMWGRDSTAELKDVWILNNYCTLLSGDCVQVNAGNWPESFRYLHHVYIAKNESFSNRQTGFWVKQASDVIISQNKSYGSNGNGGANAGAGIGYQYDKHNLWIIFNEVYDSVFGIRQSDTNTTAFENDVFMIGNLMYDIRPAPTNTTYDSNNNWHEGSCFAMWHGTIDRYIIDNTCYDVYDGINAIFNGYIEMSGNIFSEVDDSPGNRHVNIDHPGRNANNGSRPGNNNYEISNNLFYDTSAGFRSRTWILGNGTVIAGSLDEYQSGAGECSTCEYADPLFVDPRVDGSGNFRLQQGSPAIGSSAKHPAYDIFEQRYGLNIYVDFDGNPRSETAPTIGAFEGGQ